MLPISSSPSAGQPAKILQRHATMAGRQTKSKNCPGTQETRGQAMSADITKQAILLLPSSQACSSCLYLVHKCKNAVHPDVQKSTPGKPSRSKSDKFASHLNNANGCSTCFTSRESGERSAGTEPCCNCDTVFQAGVSTIERCRA